LILKSGHATIAVMLAAIFVLLRAIIVACGGHGAVSLENAALRQQLAALKRTAYYPKNRPPC
jgi:hypothetical protein